MKDDNGDVVASEAEDVLESLGEILGHRNVEGAVNTLTFVLSELIVRAAKDQEHAQRLLDFEFKLAREFLATSYKEFKYGRCQ